MKMKNIPDKIYLQVNPTHEKVDDFDQLHGITWHKMKVFYTDLEYILSSSSSDSERRGEVSDEEIEVEAKRYSRLLRKLENGQAESVAYYACINMAKWLRSRLTASGGWSDTDMIAFAEWLKQNFEYEFNKKDGWVKFIEMREKKRFTSSELLTLFRESRGKE